MDDVMDVVDEYRLPALIHREQVTVEKVGIRQLLTKKSRQNDGNQHRVFVGKREIERRHPRTGGGLKLSVEILPSMRLRLAASSAGELKDRSGNQ